MIFDLSFTRSINLTFYRSRHLILFTIFGTFAVSCEIVTRYLLIKLNMNENLSVIIGVALGITIAFYLNLNYNFYIQSSKRLRALILFGIISILSLTVQFVVKQNINFNFLNYWQERFFYAGLFFVIAYLLHRKYSFKDYKKVGIAIYMTNKENIEDIYNKVGLYPDFIHVDVVDRTMNQNINTITTHRLEVVRAFWQKHEIQTHIMSKKPLKLIKETCKYSNIIYIHYEIDEDINECIDKIKSKGVKPGIVLSSLNNYDNLKIPSNIENILILSIEKPGNSGQKFLESTYLLIDKINNLPNRKKLNLCVDGGINKENINKINAENVTSASAIINSMDPIRDIIKLQTRMDK